MAVVTGGEQLGLQEAIALNKYSGASICSHHLMPGLSTSFWLEPDFSSKDGEGSLVLPMV